MESTQLVSEFEFNIFRTLKVIESNKTLDGLFRNGSEISYNLLHSMAKQNNLDSELLNRAKQIFEKVISKNQKPLEEYLKLEIINTDEPKKTSKNKLPKHYGKKRVMEDIQSNSVISELDRAMLALNTLRNINAKLRARGIKDKMLGTQILSDADCRDIVAAVRIIENKISHILKRKK